MPEDLLLYRDQADQVADLVPRNGTLARSPLRYLRLRRLIHSFIHCMVFDTSRLSSAGGALSVNAESITAAATQCMRPIRIARALCNKVPLSRGCRQSRSTSYKIVRDRDLYSVNLM